MWNEEYQRAEKVNVVCVSGCKVCAWLSKLH